MELCSPKRRGCLNFGNYCIWWLVEQDQTRLFLSVYIPPNTCLGCSETKLDLALSLLKGVSSLEMQRPKKIEEEF